MEFLSENYVLLRRLHMLTAVLSYSLFFIRFILLMLGSTLRNRPFLKILPHLNDTLLLALAILLCVSIQQAPIMTPWLTEKVTAVVLYILTAMFALKWSKQRPGQIIWFMIATFMFAYTANIAISKSPLFF